MQFSEKLSLVCINNRDARCLIVMNIKFACKNIAYRNIKNVKIEIKCSFIVNHIKILSNSVCGLLTLPYIATCLVLDYNLRVMSYLLLRFF